MTHAICHLSVVPVRASASDKAEMISQLLFGETVEVLITDEKWAHIKCYLDKYEGWVDVKQLVALSKEDFEKINAASNTYAFDVMSAAINQKSHVPVLIGSTLPFFDGMSLSLAKKKYVFNGQVVKKDGGTDANQLVKIANKYVNSPYLWGGRSPFGIDCSGFTQVVYKMAGKTLPRDAYQQADLGELIHMVTEAKVGDLAFFDNEEGKITHVGIVFENQKIIHASGKVRIDKLDHFGIFNEDTGRYSHKLRLIKRL